MSSSIFRVPGALIRDNTVIENMVHVDFRIPQSLVNRTVRKICIACFPCKHNVETTLKHPFVEINMK